MVTYLNLEDGCQLAQRLITNRHASASFHRGINSADQAYEVMNDEHFKSAKLLICNGAGSKSTSWIGHCIEVTLASCEMADIKYLLHKVRCQW